MTPRISLEDFCNLPDSKMYELLDGELFERNSGQLSSCVGAIVGANLSSFVFPSRLGFLFDWSIGVRIFPGKPERIRRPGLAFVRRERMPGGPDGEFLETVPDLVVEVIAPDDSAIALQAKLQEYRDVGVPLIWVVYPELRTVHVIRGDRPISVLRMGDQLDGEPALPGFACDVADFFPA